MSNLFAEDIQRYIESQYLTLEALAARAEVTPEHLQQLLEARCVPPHCYEVRGDLVFVSSFGEYKIPVQPRHYFHPSLERWVGKAALLAKVHGLAEVARKIRQDFDEELTAALNGRQAPWPGGADYAWDYMMDGTWGLCLKEISVPNLLGKEFARKEVAGLMQPDPDHRLSLDGREALAAAVTRYNEVAKDFAPHEVAESSRRREIEPAVEKYGLEVD